MARHMSFFLTTPQFRARTKTVTRRKGWHYLRQGDRLTAVVKGQGLKKGEKVERLGEIEVVHVWVEPLDQILPDDVRREGFPNMTPAEFCAMFCEHNGCAPDQLVTRIEFKYLEARP